MKPSLQIGIVSDHTYLPDRVGGRESSIHDLALSFKSAGHSIRIIANSGRRLELFKFFLPRLRWKMKWGNYYQVDRVRDERNYSRNLLEKNKIDIAIYNCRHFETYVSDKKNLYTRQFFFVRDAEDIPALNPRYFPAGTHFLANSKFIANKVEQHIGIKPVVVYPVINPERYFTRVERKFVSFINPVSEKGFELAFEIAKLCHEIPFQFIEGWPLGVEGFANLNKRLAPFSNISLKPAVHDMKTVYAKTGLLLAPSQWEEGFGRVAIEAQISGIPVLASDIGGLPEAVGCGGVLIPPTAEPLVWANALREIWHDDIRWEQLSIRAQQHAVSHHLESSMVVSRILDELK